jgi:hypothetical protein
MKRVRKKRRIGFKTVLEPLVVVENNRWGEEETEKDKIEKEKIEKVEKVKKEDGYRTVLELLWKRIGKEEKQKETENEKEEKEKEKEDEDEG